jgi:hypothetical protein
MNNFFIFYRNYSTYIWDFCTRFGASTTGMITAIAFKQSSDYNVTTANNRAQDLNTEKIIRETVDKRSREIYEKTVPPYLRWVLPQPEINITTQSPPQSPSPYPNL